jgi:hypothetical protein
LTVGDAVVVGYNTEVAMVVICKEIAMV